MLSKRGISIGWKIGLGVLFGILIISTVNAVYSSIAYQKLIMKEFEARISMLGENIIELAAQPLNTYQNSQNIKEKESIRRQLKLVLDAAVTRKDILYLAIIRNSDVFLSSNSSGDNEFKIPEKRKTEIVFKGLNLFEVKIKEKKAFDITMPIEFNSGDMLLTMSSEIGQLRIGFDMNSLNKGISDTRRDLIFISLLGAVVVGVLLMLFIYMRVLDPVKKVSELSQKISNGHIGDKISIVRSNDEIGVLTSSFSDMSVYLATIAKVSEKVSSGELVNDFAPKSADDMLGNSFMSMLRYINNVAEFLSRVTRGELSAHITAKSGSDVLGNICMEMASSLKNLVQNIQKQADYMAGSSAQLREISDTSQSTIVQLAETIANISKATGESAANTQAALLSSKNAETSAVFGSKKMAELLGKIRVLSSEVDKSTLRMNKLSEHSEEIKNMVNVIRSVADETKLLSFNAAIEAARAGSEGLGFAVVAEEIRKLSDMSTDQALKISRRIKVVREDIAAAIESVAKESENMKESSRLTEETNDIFTNIVKSIDETVSQMESVASAAEEVSASSQEAAASSQEQTASMEEISAMVTEFAQTASTLKESTDKFKV